MRTKKLVAVLMGTALMGATGLGGLATAEAAEAARPIPRHDPVAPTAEYPADAPAAADAGADARAARALGELRSLIRDGVPGADPKLDARLKHAMVTAEKALASVRTHSTAQKYTHSWTLAVRPAFPWSTNGGTAPAAPEARADVPPLPDLGLDALLEAVKSLDLGAVLESLTTLLDGVLSSLTSTVSGITGSLSGITAGAVTLPDMPEVQIPNVQVPDIQLPDIQIPPMPEFTFPDITMPTFQMPGFQMPAMPKKSALKRQHAFRELPGFTGGR
ncbi:hypothetical protein OG216_27635 [Streptomycetaceae bacterium NBC_01309]